MNNNSILMSLFLKKSSFSFKKQMNILYSIFSGTLLHQELLDKQNVQFLQEKRIYKILIISYVNFFLKKEDQTPHKECIFQKLIISLSFLAFKNILRNFFILSLYPMWNLTLTQKFQYKKKFFMSRHKKTHKKSAFLLKTFQMLENPEFQQIISWSPDGVGFIVHSINELSQKVLPIYFKHSNFHSFIRQLNMYGFSKKRTPKIQNYYYHPKFCQGKSHDISEIQRRAERKVSKNIVISTQGHIGSIRNRKPIKQEEQFSIQLESKPEESVDNNSEYDKICVQFFSLLKFNHLLLNEQLANFCEIIKDLKIISQGQCEKIETYEKVFYEYLFNHLQLRKKLLSKSQRDIKNSEKYIKSLQVLETEPNLLQDCRI